MSAFKDGVLNGKVAFVAGGTSGINLGVAKRFAELGARVAVAGRNAEKAETAAAAGGVGVAATQIAKALGARVIGSASSEAKCALSLEVGADAAIDSNAADWRDQIKALTNGRGVDVVVDPVGGEATERAFRALAWNGRHLVIGFAAGDIARLPVNLALLKGGALIGVDMRQFGENEPETTAQNVREIFALHKRGVLEPKIGARSKFEDFRAAMNAAADRGQIGRVVLQVAG